MGVPRHFQKPTEMSKNSTNLSYDGGHIQKIKPKLRPSIEPLRKVKPFYNFFESDLGGYNNNGPRRGDDFHYFDNDYKFINDRLRQLLNITYWRSDDVKSFYSPPPTRDNPKLFHIDLNEPVFKAPKLDVSHVGYKHTPVSTIWLAVTSVLFCVLCILKLIVYAHRVSSEDGSIQSCLSEEQQISNISPANDQENDSDNGTFRLLVDADLPLRGNSHPDLPPPYFECAASSYGITNKSFLLTSEELPPPYSTCLGTSSNTDEIPNVDKTQTVEEPQPHTDANIHLNNINLPYSNDGH